MAKKTKHLIIPGMAKCGTTFLWDQLVNRTDKVNYYSKKELGYLSVGSDYEKYLGLFDEQKAGRVFLDATPQYGEFYREFSANAKEALKGQDAQVIFCFRDPVARAFSHYRHDLSTHFWTSMMGDYSFHNEGALRKYLCPYSEMVKSLQNAFGAENVHGFTFKQSKSTLPPSVLKMLGLPKSWKLDLDTNPALGGGVPRVVYDEKRATVLEQDGVLYSLPAKALLICSNRWTMLYPNYPASLAEKFLRHSASWTKEFDRATLGQAWTVIQKDYDATLDALGMPADELKKDGLIPYKGEMRMNDDVLAKLQKIGPVSNIAKQIYKDDAAGEPWTSGNENLPDQAITLPGQTGKIVRAFLTGDLKTRAFELRRTIEQFGPIRIYLTPYIVMQISLGNLDEVIRILELKKHAPRFIDKAKIKTVLDRKSNDLDPKKVDRVRDLAKLD